MGFIKPGEDVTILPRSLVSHSHIHRGDTRYLHATVRHGHGIISQCVTGYLTVIGAGGWCKDIARTYMVRVNRITPLERPVRKDNRSVVMDPHQKPGSSCDLRTLHLFHAIMMPSPAASLDRKQRSQKGGLLTTDSQKASWHLLSPEDGG